MTLAPVRAQQVKALGGDLLLPDREHFVRTAALIERRHQGLHNADRAVVRARLRPAFERVGLRQMPVTQLRSFVRVPAEMKACPGTSPRVTEPRSEARRCGKKGVK